MLGIGRRQIAALFESQPSQARQLDGVGEDDDGAGEAKAAQPALLGLALRIADFPAQLPCCLSLTRRKQWAKALVQVAQRLLRRARGDLIHPGHRRLLERIQVPMQLDRRGTRPRGAVRLLLARQSPVVCPARRACMALAGGDLPIIQRQLGFVRPLDEAHGASADFLCCVPHAGIGAASTDEACPLGICTIA